MSSPFLLPHLIRDAAERDPDHLALMCRDQEISYGDLWDRAMALAATLVRLGVKPQDRVGVYLNKGIQAGIAIHGIMAAGAAYVPLDPTSPPSRLQFVIEDCGIRHLISDDRKAPAIAKIQSMGTTLDTVVGMSRGDEVPFPVVPWSDLDDPLHTIPAVTEMDLSYILYTSGSTGVPKGIMHSHRSAISWANVTAAAYEISHEDRISNYAPLHFDLSTLDFFGGARAGATTVMIPEEHMKMPASLAALIERSRMTLFYTVPLALVQLAGDGVVDGRDFSALRRILFGGEPMPVKHLRALMEKLPGTRFFNVYGPTEVNGCTHHEVASPPTDDLEGLPIGRPYDNVEMRIVDGDDQPVEPGTVGELLIRSPTMMRGYWARPDLNENAFYFEERFAGLPETFHRTGDLVHIDEDSLIHFHGRKDRQVKTRGYRVELDEVEAVLVSHPGVAEAAVYGVDSGDLGTLIHGAAISRESVDIDAAEITRYLADGLPSYAVPTHIDIRTEFPRTTSGKIDRRALALQAAAAKGAGDE